jgi:hypothetical protein
LENKCNGLSSEFSQNLEPFSDNLHEIVKKFQAELLLSLMENKDKDFITLSRLGNIFFRKKERFNMDILKAD